MFSNSLKEYAQNCYKESQKGFGSLKGQIEENMSNIHGDERTLMELCYGTLPSSDIGSVGFDTLRSYTAHAMMLYNTYEQVRGLPEDIFLHFVFYPRINSESLVDCRSFFYNQLKDIMGISDSCDRVLAVNRWCAGKVTYESSDDRTESPMAAYYSGTGRCGEESVFAVTALRSVGIPTRQVYVPWWSHCDDNHAWVEAYVKGGWCFLGACEPEPVLNRGWFTDAASRALLVHSRTFFDYGIKDEDFIGKHGTCLMYNQTLRYAKTAAVRITVVNKDGMPAVGAKVSFMVINMAHARKIAEVITDEHGTASINLGCGSMLLEAFYKGMYGIASLKVDAGDGNEAYIALRGELPCSQVIDLDFAAPAATDKNTSIVNRELQLENKKVIEKARTEREMRLSSYWKEEYEGYDSHIREILHLAGGNAGELRAFYDEKPESLKPMAIELLKALSKKDYKDVNCHILNQHFYGALSLKGHHEEAFIPYVMCPRIGWEELEDWRSAINEAFTDTQKEQFVNNPPCLMQYINDHYKEGSGRYYDALTMTPCGVLALRSSDEKGRNTLFVAAMRTLGVPSRLNPCDGSAEYFKDGQFYRAADGYIMNSVIELVPEEGKRFTYSSDYSLSKWEGQGYELLNYSGENLDNKYRIQVCGGYYRLITTNRLPNGNQLVRIKYFNVDKGESEPNPNNHIPMDNDNCRGRSSYQPVKRVSLTSRTAKTEEMLEDNPLQPFKLSDECGNIISQSTRRIIAYLDLGTEPTEHILNEMLECSGTLQNEMDSGLQVVLVLPAISEKNNTTLVKVLHQLPHIILAFDDFEDTPDSLARAMYLEPGKCPLVLLLDSHNHGRYGSCGYSVGLLELILKLSKLIGNA